MPQYHSKGSGTGASNNKPSVMIYLQGSILSGFPIIMIKESKYVVVSFREVMTGHIEAVFQSEFISIFKCTQEISKVIISFRLFQFLVTQSNLNQLSCGKIHENDVSWFHKIISLEAWFHQEFQRQ